MFYLKDKIEIGKFIERSIKGKYKTISDFCRACLKYEGNDNEFRNIKNHYSQVINGHTDVQLKDLEELTFLLDVSCEEILSAGEARTMNENHLTNYQVAFSDDKTIWQNYIDSEEKPILNPDEYNKTVIDYALEFRNYDFLKYLMDKNLIWFVSKTPEKDCFLGFGAGTSIKRKELPFVDPLDYRMESDDSLRRKMIALAIERSDLEMLDKLRAREIPSMYTLRKYGTGKTEFEEHYDIDLVASLVKADEKVLDYFSSEIDILSAYGEEKYTFMFPEISLLLDKLIENKNECAKAILERCIEHNKNTYKIIREIKDRRYEENGFVYSNFEFSFFEDGNIISVFDREKTDGTVTNIVKVSVDSDSLVVSDLIKELNKIYDSILAFDTKKGE